MIVILYLTIICCACYIFYYFSFRNFNYWKDRNVPYLKPTMFLGNYGDFILLKKYIGEVTQDICGKFPNSPYIGAYYATKPVLIVRDPELVKLVTTKEFSSFNSRELSEHTHKEVITQTLFFTYGDRWNALRQHLTPLFTASKMKNMFPLIKQCNEDLKAMLKRETLDNIELNAKTVTVRYAMDCVMSCVFGVETKTMSVLSKDFSKNVFAIVGDKIFEVSNTRALNNIARSVHPSLFYLLGRSMFPLELKDFFYELAIKVFKQRNYQPTSRNDFMDLCLHLRNNGSVLQSKTMNIEFDDNTLIGLCLLLFATGFETSASTLSYVLYELAKNTQAQRRLQGEVDEYIVKNNGELEYDCISRLPYLDACVAEAIRLYPVLGVVTREVVEDHTLSTSLKLEKGLLIHIPVYQIHHNPKYFVNPEEYRPERFMAEEKHKIKPYTFMPFGEGPRICIGARMAKMVMFSALLNIFKNYQVELADNMPKSLSLDPRGFVTVPRNEIVLKFKSRSNPVVI